MMLTVHNFSNGAINPALGYTMAFVGSFLGLRCVNMARVREGASKGGWLSVAAVSIGATGIWGMHFIAMLGFSVPGYTLYYNVPLTILSMLVAVAVVGVGLFIVGFGNGGWPRIVLGGTILGVGVSAMHYMGMAAMVLQGRMSYSIPLVALSVLIGIVAGTAGLWMGTWVHGVGAAVGAALVMAVAVTGMHYTGMAALRVFGSSLTSAQAIMGMNQVGAGDVSGGTAAAFLLPALLVISAITFLMTLVISMAPTEDELNADADFLRRIEYMQRRRT
jgi:NO-binding membrane sensor protein with MHYT domain